MTVTEAVVRRTSVRAFKADPVPGAVVRSLIEGAARAPSGGNLQPWRVYALTGEPLETLKAKARETMARGLEEGEYDVYPPNLWDPFRTRRFQCGEDLYASIEIPREDRAGRLAQLAQNLNFFGAPVGLFFALDRKLGPPQWADVGMYMQTLMLLAAERGLDTCAQEFWARLPKTVGSFLNIPEDHMLFSGMALGYREETHPINGWRTRRDAVEDFAEFQGF